MTTTNPQLNPKNAAHPRILIVGGGVAGLSAALFLAWRGVSTVLVERHAGSSLHPRAVGFTTKTLELLRAVGLEASIPQLPLGQGRPRRVAVESLAGTWSDEVPWTPDVAPDVAAETVTPPKDGYSPCTGSAIAQDRLEPILRDKAIELGADVRMNTTLVSFEQHEDGIAAVLRRRDGSEYTLDAGYMIAADGHASPVRAILGIGRGGHGLVRVMRSVVFRADLDRYLESGISQFELDQPNLNGMLTTYRDGRWLLMVGDDEGRNEGTLREIVIRALGRSDLDVEIITSGRWELSALIADRFSSDRVFLAGDAAHTLPPARGGYGANTGIEDAWNLAWKLASVLSGSSTPGLLETYEAERRPIAWLRHDQIFARQDYAAMATEAEKEVAIIVDVAMELGQLYRSSAVVGAGEELPPARRPDLWAGQPGTRAPHLWVSRAEERVSTLDLFYGGWVLVSEDSRWRSAAAEASVRTGLPLQNVYVGDSKSAGGTRVSAPPEGAAALTLDTPIHEIVAEPAGQTVLDLEIPEVTLHTAYEMLKSMSPRQLQQMSPEIITDAKLARLATGLAGVECRPTSGDPAAFRRMFCTAFGIGSEGASLVRPDGYVAWRSFDMPLDPASALADAMERAACAKKPSQTFHLPEQAEISTPIEDRLRRIEDVQAIQDLVYTWTFHVNKGSRNTVVDVEAMRKIYTEDVVGESPGMKLRIEGIDDLIENLRTDTSAIVFSMHSLTNPIIKVEGETAVGDWLMWIAVKRPHGFRQVYMNVNHCYARTAQGWRIARVRMDVEAALQIPAEQDLMAGGTH